MVKPLAVLKSVGPKLVPFLKTVAIFFVLHPTEPRLCSIVYAIIKILPILSLMIFVLLHGMNFSSAFAYSRKILAGLIFSAFGDVLLVWKDSCFSFGLLSFAVAQALYAWAFGLCHINWSAGAFLACFGATVYAFLLPGLNGPMVYLAGFYLVLILTMAWRAVARTGTLHEMLNDLWTWTRLCSCLGAIFFMISDLIIAIDKFRIPVPFAHTLIMFTYYAAQLGISLSVVDSQVDAIIESTARPHKIHEQKHIAPTNDHQLLSYTSTPCTDDDESDDSIVLLPVSNPIQSHNFQD